MAEAILRWHGTRHAAMLGEGRWQDLIAIAVAERFGMCYIGRWGRQKQRELIDDEGGLHRQKEDGGRATACGVNVSTTSV